jgi:penicillin-binding protein 1A
VLAAAGGAAGLYFWAASDLPGFKTITDYNPPLVTTVYTRNGEVLGHFYKEKRFLVTMDQISHWVPKAFLAAEDSSFYQHEGVDISAIFRAFVKNLKAGHVVQGGSTITQQVIKRLLLTPEKSYQRKLKEAILAYRLEHYLTKDEILTIYLNQIFFGAHAYGIEAAARVYFGKHAKELSLAEAALLVGLPRAPSRYNPYHNPESAKIRQRYVLDRMLETGFIDRDQYEYALEQPLEYKGDTDPSWERGAYYLEEVRRWLIDRFGEETVYNAGLQVYTPADLKHLEAAEAAVRKGLEDSAKRRGWPGPPEHLEKGQFETFFIENKTEPEDLASDDWIKILVVAVEEQGADVRFGDYKGRISVDAMAWCRKPDPSKAPEDVRDVKDAREVLETGDVVWASLVDPLSESDLAGGENATAAVAEFKKRTWEMALEREPEVEGALVSMKPDTGEVLALVGGYDFNRSHFNRATQARRQPGSAFKPIVYSAALDNGFTPSSVILDAPIVYQDQINDRLWKPENFEGVFYGPTLLRTALVKSRNLVTIRVAKRLGIKTIIERAKALGLEADFPHDLSVSLGSASVTLVNLCRAYSTFARLGSYVEPRMVLRVESAWGEELYASEVVTKESISPQTAYIIVRLLQEVVRDGTGWRARALGRPVAGKTGTTNEEQDAWFMGFAPYLLTGVYVGFDQLTPMGKWETGSRAASPIWVNYRKAVEDEYPVQDFRQPPGVVMARIDPETGLLAGAGAEDSYFLPFKAGTQPVQTAQDSGGGKAVPGGSDAGGEDLMKQVF